MAESKSARKNRKRRETKKETEGFVIEEVITTQPPPPPAPALSVDPLTALQTQLAEAKAAKDNIRAQELREKIWAINDITLLGRQPDGAPKLDLGTVVPVTETPKAEALTVDPTEKKLIKLKKKLEQVESLKAKRARGERLEKNQLAKIESQSEVEEEIKILEDLLRNHTVT